MRPVITSNLQKVVITRGGIRGAGCPPAEVLKYVNYVINLTLEYDIGSHETTYFRGGTLRYGKRFFYCFKHRQCTRLAVLYLSEYRYRAHNMPANFPICSTNASLGTFCCLWTSPSTPAGITSPIWSGTKLAGALGMYAAIISPGYHLPNPRKRLDNVANKDITVTPLLPPTAFLGCVIQRKIAFILNPCLFSPLPPSCLGGAVVDRPHACCYSPLLSPLLWPTQGPKIT